MTRTNARSVRRDASFSVASLFAGCGGLDLGFREAGFRTVWANDRDEHALNTFRMHSPDAEVVLGNAERVRFPKRGSVDVVIGGPPCQGFSVAGRMDPSDPRSALVWTFLDAVDVISPRAFVLENVKALAVGRRWHALMRSMQRRSAELGYQTELHVLNAADFGVPQVRQRMFLIGVRGTRLPQLQFERRAPAEWTSVRECFQSLPAFGEPGNDTFCSAKIVPARVPVLRPSPWAGMLFNGSGRPLDLDRPATTLPASMGGNRTPIVDQRAIERGGSSSFLEYHSALCEGRELGAVMPGDLRRITVEEAAALQSFPLGMEWHGPLTAKFRQVGNAVPPKLAAAVAKGVADALNRRTRASA